MKMTTCDMNTSIRCSKRINSVNIMIYRRHHHNSHDMIFWMTILWMPLFLLSLLIPESSCVSGELSSSIPTIHTSSIHNNHRHNSIQHYHHFYYYHYDYDGYYCDDASINLYHTCSSFTSHSIHFLFFFFLIYFYPLKILLMMIF